MNYLIDDAYLTENTYVSTSNNDKNMKIAMQSVTFEKVKPLLGKPLYELFETHVTDETTLNDKQAELFGLVQYYMGILVEREMLYNILNINNKGVTQDEHVANMDVINTKRQAAAAKADFVKKSILEYLESNKESFPESYPEMTTTVKKDTPYSTGIVFDFEPKKYFV